MVSLGDEDGMRVNTFDMLRKATGSVKGLSNVDKGHFKATNNAKKEPYKQRQHPRH